MRYKAHCYYCHATSFLKFFDNVWVCEKCLIFIDSEGANRVRSKSTRLDKSIQWS